MLSTILIGVLWVTQGVPLPLAILAALGLTPHPMHCAEDDLCDADCATNILGGAAGAWGTSLSCWNNVERWARTNGIVRCTNLE